MTTLPPVTSTVATTTTSPTTTATTPPLPAVTCSVSDTGTDDDFYRRTCSQDGIDILASGDVDGAALDAAAERMANLLAERRDLADAVAASVERVVIIGRDERITDLPEFADLYKLHPGTDWNRRGRSFPGTEVVPVAAGAEENLLCLDADRYAGEDMFIHDFAWTLRRFGIAAIDLPLDRAIEDAYGRAIAAGLWQNTLAEVNSDEYWAEGAQSFFDANGEASDDKDQVHNDVNTREELHAYDPLLFELLASVFGDGTWRPACPGGTG